MRAVDHLTLAYAHTVGICALAVLTALIAYHWLIRAVLAVAVDRVPVNVDVICQCRITVISRIRELLSRSCDNAGVYIY